MAGKHVWTDAEEFVLERAINKHVKNQGLQMSSFKDGDFLTQGHLWPHGKKKNGGKTQRQQVLAEIEMEFRAQESKGLQIDRITGVSMESKVDNWIKYHHLEFRNGYIQRTLACRQGKLNQRIACAQYHRRAQDNMQMREEQAAEQASARDKQIFWTRLQKEGASKSLELAFQHQRDLCGTPEKIREACGPQVSERCCRADVEMYIRKRDSRCICDLLDEVSSPCVVFEEYAEVAGALEIRPLSMYVEEAARHQGCAYEKTSAIEHAVPYSCGGLSAPSNLAQMCNRCHDRKTRSESMIGHKVIEQFAMSCNSVLDIMFFENGWTPSSLNRCLKLEHMALIREHEKFIDGISGLCPYRPTQHDVARLRARHYFQSHYRRLGWLLMNSSERRLKMDRLRKVQTLEQLVIVLSTMEMQSLAAQGTNLQCLETSFETPRKRKRPRNSDADMAEVIDIE